MRLKKKMVAAEQKLEEQNIQQDVSTENPVEDSANGEATVESTEDIMKKSSEETSGNMENMTKVDEIAAAPETNPDIGGLKKGRRNKVKKIRAAKGSNADKKDSGKFKKNVKEFFAKVREMITYADEKTLPLRRQIRFKLVVAFIVPVVFIILLGMYSYLSTKGKIVGSYENSAKVSIDNSSQYIKLLMDEIQTKSSQLAGNDDFIYYYTQYDSMDVVDAQDKFEKFKDITTTLKNSSVGVYNFYAFGKMGNPMSTLESTPSTSLYSDFKSSKEAKTWKELAKQKNGVTYAWLGYHKSIDSDTEASSAYYTASFIRKFSQGDGYIVFDLAKDEVQNVLEKSIVSKGSITAFITKDGRETIVSGSKKAMPKLTNGKTAFANEKFYQKYAVNGSKVSDKKYVTFNGKKTLFVYSKIGDTGSVICTLIPQSDILGQLYVVRTITFIIVIVTCLIAIFIGLVLSTDIAKVLGKFSRTFKRVADGDFTAKVDTKRQDEFGELAHDMNDMIGKIKDLVADMANFGHSVSDAAIKVSGASGEILTSVNEVSDTVNVMGQGVSEQASDTEKSFQQMTEFAGQIGEASDGFVQVGQVANKTQQTISGGKDIINELIQQVTSTSEVTGVIIKDIDELQQQSKSIGSVVGTINDIASTTNLLSLNASIEAARAGDAGRGFAVVAEQIRSLAEQSVESVKSIEKIIKSIQEKTLTTATSAKNTEQMLSLQTDALNKTVKVFQDVDNHMLALMDKINHIMNNMETITVSKDEVLDAIKNIAAVTQQTLASSEVVTTNINTQITSVETLNAQAEEMKDRAKKLEDAIAKFTI